MTGWIVFGSILLVLFLLSLLRLGAEITYGEAGLKFRVRVGQIRIPLYPRKRRTRRRQKKTKAKQTASKPAGKPARDQQPLNKDSASSGRSSKPSGQNKAAASTSQAKPDAPKPDKGAERTEEEPEKKGGLPLPLMGLISLVLEAAAGTIARLQVDTLEIRYTIPGKGDPASAAIQYGLICAGEGGLVPVLENSFYRVKCRDIRAWVDFESATPLIWLRLALSIRLGQLISVASRAGWAFLKAYRQQKDEQKQQQEGKQNGTEASDQ